MMETGARYVLVGLFALAVIAGGFGFVFWLHHSGGLGERASYQVQFASSVSGLRAGSAVLFNGIRVGEVTALEFSPANPQAVTATMQVERGTPVRADTQVSVEVQGLMGSPAIALRGGKADAPPLAAAPGKPAMLTADPGATQDTMQAAREVLRHLDQVIADNAEPLRGTIANLKTFTGALAQNSGKLDGIVEGLERMVGAAPAKPPPRSFDLTAPPAPAQAEPIPSGQLAIADPTAVVALETQRILIVAKTGEPPVLADVQWADSIPKLIQARLLQGFENAQYSRVSRAIDTITSDYQLLIDIRTFRVFVADGTRTAEVEFGAKILKEGRIVEAKLFRASVPAAGLEAPEVAAAMDQAFGSAARELIGWTLKALVS